MDSALQLIIMSVVMFLGSYFFGSAPLIMPLKEKTLQRVSVMGAGLLVGTALAVIIPEGMQTMIKAYERADSRASKDHIDEHSSGHSHSHDPLEGLDKAIGVSLVLGFVFMMLVDQLASASSGAKSTLESGSSGSSGHHVNWTTTLGLVVHAAADGIALGAAACTNQTDVEVIVFLAIMLHKAPAAFGLATFLLHEGMDRPRVRRHLMTFSLSAPVTAILTFLALTAHGGATAEDQIDTFNATGIAMLFSAGTFLYVATVHVLPEVTNVGGGHSHSGGNTEGGFSKCELLMLVIGCLMPLLLTLGHSH